MGSTGIQRGVSLEACTTLYHKKTRYVDKEFLKYHNIEDDIPG